MKQKRNGYSLIEVLVAIAITSVVLLTVLTLFYMGRRNIYSGKQTTQAVAVGTRILEDFENMTVTQVRSNFNLTDASGLATVTLNNVASVGQITIANSISRDSSSCTITAGPPVTVACGANDPSSFLANWYQLLLKGTADKNTVLVNPTIGLIFTPRAPSNADGAHNVSTAQFMKIRVYIAWDEGPGRRRYAFFDTTRM